MRRRFKAFWVVDAIYAWRSIMVGVINNIKGQVSYAHTKITVLFIIEILEAVRK